MKTVAFTACLHGYKHIIAIPVATNFEVEVITLGDMKPVKDSIMDFED